MAGSWAHMTTKSGKLRSNESFTDMIENLGDAYEAAEECYGMVWFLAEAIAYRDDMLHLGSRRPPRDKILDAIRQAEANYRDGLKIGGVQDDD